MHIVLTIANNSSVPYFKWFAEKIAREGIHKISFVMLHTEKPDMIAIAADSGFDCYWIKFDHQKRKIGMIRSFFKMCRLLKKLNPDVVQTNLFDDSLPTLFAAKLLNIKKRVIVKQDTTFHYYYAPKWIKADKFNNGNATHIVPVSKEAENFILEKEDADPGKITMIHHGIPPEIFTNQSEKYKKELIQRYGLENKIVIGTVARLIEWKGYRYILKAAAEIIKTHPNAVFLFVGEGEQKNELISLAEKYNIIDNIIFTGWVDRAYIPSLYSILDVYVHAASFEPFGFVIPEAMMNEAPIVSTPTGSALDAIKHKENGYLCEYENAESIVDGVLYMLKHGKEFKGKAKDTALKMYSFNVMFDNYLKLYEE